MIWQMYNVRICILNGILPVEKRILMPRIVFWHLLMSASFMTALPCTLYTNRCRTFQWYCMNAAFQSFHQSHLFDGACRICVCDFCLAENRIRLKFNRMINDYSEIQLNFLLKIAETVAQFNCHILKNPLHL